MYLVNVQADVVVKSKSLENFPLSAFYIYD